MSNPPETPRILDSTGKPLGEPPKKRLRERIPVTKVVTWITFFYVFVVNGNQFLLVVNSWFSGPQDVTVQFDHTRRLRESIQTAPGLGFGQADTFDGGPIRFPAGPPGQPKSTLDNDTEFIDLQFQLVNHSEKTITIEKVEIECTAVGTIPDGVYRAAVLTPSAEYTLYLPDLSPNQQQRRFIKVPHTLKPDEADAFTVVLQWRGGVSLTGTYTITPTLITSVGEQELASFDVPVLSDKVPVP